MAFVYITEYAEVPQLNGESLSIGTEPGVAEQQVAIAAGSTQSSAFNAKTKFIRVHTDAIVSIKIGANPTAVNTAHRLAANQTDFYGVAQGDKLATITNT